MEESQIYPYPSRAWLDVDGGALARNAQRLQTLSGARLLPMVKANAYGVGVAGVVRALEPLDPWGYGVATVVEGEEIRRLGVTRPIVVFTPLLDQDFAAARRAQLTPTLGSAASIHAWSTGSEPYHLAIDTGMNRAGCSWRTAATLRDVVRMHPPAGAFTHYHSSELDDGSIAVQERRFRDALDALGVTIPFLHIANSAGIVREPHAYDAVRPGVFLYGVGSGAEVEPEPVVALRARVVEIHVLEPGDSVSYDATFVATRRSRIATVAAGYGDGYPRSLSGRGAARIGASCIPLRGLVTMDMTMFDVTDTECSVGDVVTLIDGAEDPELSVESVAAAADMSPYELLTGLADRLERRYRQS